VNIRHKGQASIRLSGVEPRRRAEPR
jgi:hypothetical protein